MSVFQLCKLHSTCVMKCYKILSTLKAQITVTLWRFSVRALSTSLTEKKNTILTQNWCWCRTGLQHFCLDQHEGIWRLRHARPDFPLPAFTLSTRQRAEWELMIPTCVVKYFSIPAIFHSHDTLNPDHTARSIIIWLWLKMMQAVSIPCSSH